MRFFFPRLTHLCRQALAAVGQGRLIALWDNLFGQLGQPIAQVLLTRGDISDVSFNDFDICYVLDTPTAYCGFREHDI